LKEPPREGQLGPCGIEQGDAAIRTVLGPALAKTSWKNILKRQARSKLPSAGVLARPPEPDGAPSTTALEPLLVDAVQPSGALALIKASSSVAFAVAIPRGVDAPELIADNLRIDTSAIQEPTTSTHSNLAKIGQATLHGMRTIALPIAEKAAGVIPLAGPPLKAAIGGLVV